MAYTLKEINAVGGKILYNIVAICTPQVMMEIKDNYGKNHLKVQNFCLFVTKILRKKVS